MQCHTTNPNLKPCFGPLVDCTEMPFTHGHLYVESSRVRSPDNIAYYFDAETADLVTTHQQSVVTNIVYSNLTTTSSNNIVDIQPIDPVRWGAQNLDMVD